MAEKRDKIIDSIKGMAIILMVIGHSRPPVCLRDFIYLFHMPLFFLIAGYLYNPSYAESINGVGKYVWRKIKRLWFPFVFWGGAFILLHNLFLSWNIYSNAPEVLAIGVGGLDQQGLLTMWSNKEIIHHLIRVPFMLDGMTGMAGAFWFLKTMFSTLIAYTFVEAGLSKLKLSRAYWQSIVSLVLLVASYRINLLDGYFGFHFFAGYSLIHVGRLVRLYFLKYDLKLVDGCASLALLIVGLLAIREQTVWSIPALMVLLTLASFVALSVLSRYVDCSFVGKYTMPILIFHFLAFKLVTLIGVAVHGGGYSIIGAFPVAFQTGLWWIAYSIVGVCAPVAMGWMYGKVKSLIYDR